MTEVGVGLLGTGFAGRAHAHAILEARRLGDVLPTPIAVYSRSGARARDFARRFMFKRFYTDWHSLMRDGEVSVVVNALPNYEHEKPNIEAVEAGKDVLSEKPLGRSLEEAIRQAEAAEAAGVVHGVGFNHRWLPAVQAMRRLLSEGFVGRVRFFRGFFLEDWAFDPNMLFAWRFSEKLAGYGVVGDNGSHVIDLARHLVGEIVEVVACLKTFIASRPLSEGGWEKVTNDDLAVALLRFENDVLGVLECSRVLPGRTNYMVIEVYGDRGAMAFNLERPDELWVSDYSESEDSRGFKRIRVLERTHPGMRGFWGKHSLGWAASFSIQLSAFVKASASRSTFKPDFWDGVTVNAVLDAIKRSAAERRWVEVEKVR